jgi:hypothetical protein
LIFLLLLLLLLLLVLPQAEEERMLLPARFDPSLHAGLVGESLSMQGAPAALRLLVT